MCTCASVPVGMDISPIDLVNIQRFASRVIELSRYRQELSEYLSNKMALVAPNLTTLIGEQVSVCRGSPCHRMLSLYRSEHVSFLTPGVSPTWPSTRLLRCRFWEPRKLCSGRPRCSKWSTVVLGL